MSAEQQLAKLIRAIERTNVKDQVMACLDDDASFQTLIQEISSAQCLTKQQTDELCRCITEENVSLVPPWALAHLVSTEQSNDIVNQHLDLLLSWQSTASPKFSPTGLFAEIFTHIKRRPYTSFNILRKYTIFVHVNPISDDTLSQLQAFDIFNLEKYVPSCSDDVTVPVFKITSTKYVCIRTAEVQMEYVQLDILANVHFFADACCAPPIHLSLDNIPKMSPELWTIRNFKLSNMIQLFSPELLTDKLNHQITWSNLMHFCKEFCFDVSQTNSLMVYRIMPAFANIMHVSPLTNFSWHELLCLFFK